MRHPELVARLDASAERLTAGVLAEMYADPFWQARFGVRADLSSIGTQGMLQSGIAHALQITPKHR